MDSFLSFLTFLADLLQLGNAGNPFTKNYRLWKDETQYNHIRLKAFLALTFSIILTIIMILSLIFALISIFLFDL